MFKIGQSIEIESKLVVARGQGKNGGLGIMTKGNRVSLGGS